MNDNDDDGRGDDAVGWEDGVNDDDDDVVLVVGKMV